MNKSSVALLVAALSVCSGVATAQNMRLPTVSAPISQSADHIVAVVNSEPITNSEVRARLARIEPPANGQLPPRDELMRQVLERLILEKAQIQQAQEQGVKVDDAAVNDAEQNVARQNRLTVPQLYERLKTVGLTPAAFRANLRSELLLQRGREREVDGRVRVTELDIDAYLQEHQGAATDAQTVLNLGHVLVRVPENADAALLGRLQARAEQVAQRARSGDDFSALAREFSESPEGQTGGQLGARPADRYPGLFVDAVRALKAGAVVGPLRSGAGFHVLKVLEKRNANLPDSHYTQTLARHILLRPTGAMTEEAAIARLQVLRQRIVTGQVAFEAAAREVSQDGSASNGGDLGWASPGQFVPEFEQVMNALSLGQVSEPVVSRFGVHLIQVQQRRQVELSPREVREWVRNVLREQKADQAYEEWAQEVRGRAFVEYRDAPQ